MLRYIHFYCFFLENITYLSSEHRSFLKSRHVCYCSSTYEFPYELSIFPWVSTAHKFPLQSLLVWKVLSHCVTEGQHIFCSLKICLRRAPLSVPPGCVLLKMKMCLWCGLLEVHWPKDIFWIWFCFSALEEQSLKLIFKKHELLLFILLLCTYLSS